MVVNVINLIDRKDRWEKVSEEFKSLNLKRFDAITHQDPWRGCSLSHIELIKQAKENGDDFCFVLEDDAIMTNPEKFSEDLDNIMVFLNENEWDVFNGAPTYTDRDQNISSERDYIFFEFGRTTHFMIYNSSSYDRILSVEEIINDPNRVENEAIIDIIINQLDLKMVTKIPFISIQRSNYSDLAKREISYQNDFTESENLLKKHIK